MIDWANAAVAPGALDPAMTALIVSSVGHAPAGSDMALAVDDLGPWLTDFLSVFLEAVGGDLLSGLGEAERRRAGDPALSEVERASVRVAARQVRSALAGQ